MKPELNKRHSRDNSSCYKILEHLSHLRTHEFRSANAGTARLYREETDSVDFMSSNPNDRINYAAQSGLFPS